MGQPRVGAITCTTRTRASHSHGGSDDLQRLWKSSQVKSSQSIVGLYVRWLCSYSPEIPPPPNPTTVLVCINEQVGSVRKTVSAMQFPARATVASSLVFAEYYEEHRHAVTGLLTFWALMLVMLILEPTLGARQPPLRATRVSRMALAMVRIVHLWVMISTRATGMAPPSPFCMALLNSIPLGCQIFGSLARSRLPAFRMQPVDGRAQQRDPANAPIDAVALVRHASLDPRHSSPPARNASMLTRPE